jgi:tetratricopeptide (TPR) repeat protein
VHFLSVVLYAREDFEGAARAVVSDGAALLEGGKDDSLTTIKALTHTGGCLAILGREIPKAQAMLVQARDLAAEQGLGLDETHFRLGLGCVHHHRGELDEATRELQSTAERAGRERDHFRASVCLSHLAMIALERADDEGAIRHATELTAIADKLGDGSEGPFGKAIVALASRRLGQPGAEDRLETALSELRAIDSKGWIAYVLSHAAALDLAAGEARRAFERSRVAIELALAVARPSDAAFGYAVRARAAHELGEAREATAALSGLDELEEAGGLSARALGARLRFEVPLANPSSTRVRARKSSRF